MRKHATFAFTAFISYKRGGEDERWAKWLQRRLEAFRIPTSLAPATPRRLKIFRDKTDLGSHAALDKGLTQSLDACRYLIVVCSPRSAVSPYVADEVAYFQATGRADNIIPFIIDGTPAPRTGEAQCYPPPLNASALGITLSEGSKEEALIKVVARLLDVDFHALYQRHLRAQRRFMLWVAAALSVVVLAVTGLALWAVNAEQRATAQRLEAEGLVEYLSWDLRIEILKYMPTRVQNAILEKVAAYHKKWHTPTMDARNLRALHNKNAAVTAAEKADWPAYARHINEAFDILTALHNEYPADRDIHVSLWRLHREHVKTLHMRDGLTAEVRQHIATANELFRTLMQNYDDANLKVYIVSENMSYEISFNMLEGAHEKAFERALDVVKLWEGVALKQPDFTSLELYYGDALDTACRVSHEDAQRLERCVASLKYTQGRLAHDTTNQRLMERYIFTLMMLFVTDSEVALATGGVNLDELQVQARKQHEHDPANKTRTAQFGMIMLMQALRARDTGAGNDTVLAHLDATVRLLTEAVGDNAAQTDWSALLQAARDWRDRLRAASPSSPQAPQTKEAP